MVSWIASNEKIAFNLMIKQKNEKSLGRDLNPRPRPYQGRAIPLSHQGTVAVRASPKYHTRDIKVSTEAASNREKFIYWLKIRGFCLKKLGNWQGKLPVSLMFVFWEFGFSESPARIYWKALVDPHEDVVVVDDFVGAGKHWGSVKRGFALKDF